MLLIFKIMQNIEVCRERVEEALRKFLNKKLDEDGKYSPEIKEMIANILEYNLRKAKRIRPITTIFAYKCFKDDDKIIDASIFIELMQAYYLIHDDIMDKSDLRRGIASIHKIYGKKHGEHFGISMAILAGNLCSSYTYESVVESDFNSEEKVKAVKYINWIDDRENYGQALDIFPGFETLKEEDVLRIYELKTATYTMQGPIYVGGVLAGASEEEIEKLQEYAYNVGIAFQIQDDLNGVFGNVAETGKPDDSDIKEGKKTLIIAKTLELCNKDNKEFILKEYGNENISQESLEKIRELIKKCGAFDYCKKKLKELIEKGKNSIKDVELREEGKNYLLEMADYIGGLFGD
jgi:geranylgeranyl diphosphate synthase type I